jgi:hypothetical protein
VKPFVRTLVMSGFMILTASLIAEVNAAPQDSYRLSACENQSREEKACNECAANIAAHFDFAICKQANWQNDRAYWDQWHALFDCVHRVCEPLTSYYSPCQRGSASSLLRLIESMKQLERLCLSDSKGQEDPRYRVPPDQDPRYQAPPKKNPLLPGGGPLLPDCSNAKDAKFNPKCLSGQR